MWLDLKILVSLKPQITCLARIPSKRQCHVQRDFRVLFGRVCELFFTAIAVTFPFANFSFRIFLPRHLWRFQYVSFLHIQGFTMHIHSTQSREHFIFLELSANETQPLPHIHQHFSTPPSHQTSEKSALSHHGPSPPANPGARSRNYVIHQQPCSGSRTAHNRTI
jgi:hypothetical protein